MNNSLSSREPYWDYLSEWCAWWIMLPVDGLSAQRGFGPFNATEAVWAGEIHHIPFAVLIGKELP